MLHIKTILIMSASSIFAYLWDENRKEVIGDSGKKMNLFEAFDMIAKNQDKLLTKGNALEYSEGLQIYRFRYEFESNLLTA